MTRLARDVRGNTLAMMAMFLIPLSGLVGSAVDMSRLYVVKARLQQACDAGALAGRKAMTTTNATLDPAAVTQATTFFSNNFKMDQKPAGTLGFMNTNAVTFVPTKTSDSQVAATASAAVPMTITQMFGTASVTVSVACQARYDVADTDVMFVLDTTGSMACLPSDSDTTCSSYAGAATKFTYTRLASSGGVAGYAGSVGLGTTEKSGSRIEALRQAVLSFYDTFAATADKTTNVRYGFVTYSSVVNAGQAILDLSPNYMVGSNGSADKATYQSRSVKADYTVSYTETANNKTQTQCTTTHVRSPATAQTYAPSSGTATDTYNEWVNTSSNNNTKVCKTRVDTLGPTWEYKPIAFDVSSLLSGGTITDPTKVHGQTTGWIGCVETPVDTAGQTSFTTTSLPSELNPDIVPAKVDPNTAKDTRWWPHLQDLEYGRNTWSSTATDTSDGDHAYLNPNYGVDPYMPSETYNRVVYDNTYMRNGGYTTCGKPVKRLGVMSRDQVYSYVYANDFVSMGGTYHDTGMIWGTRLISPTGLWKDDTKAWPLSNQPNRVIIFLTDGDMAPNDRVYGMYGVESLDDRVSGSSTTDVTTLHNNRFLAECAAAKARNIDVWTVSIDTAANAQLTACASTASQALFTTDGKGLSDVFATIARRLAMLRITK